MPSIRVQGADGRLYPAQARTLVRYADGSVRWLQVLSQAPSGPAQVLLDAAFDTPDPGVTAQVTGHTAVMSNHLAQVVVDVAAGTITLRRKEEVIEIGLAELTGEDGAVAVAGGGSVELVTAGPVQATVRVSGTLVGDPVTAGSFAYEAWVSLSAGLPVASITHVLKVVDAPQAERSQPRMSSLKGMTLPVAIPEASKVWFLGSEEKGEDERPRALGRRVIQWEDHAFEHERPDSGDRQTGRRIGNGVWWSLESGLGFVCVEDLWQQYPKGWSLSEGSLKIELFPHLETPVSGRYDQRENTHIWYYHLREGRYTLRAGVEKSHHFHIGFEDAGDLHDAPRFFSSMASRSIGMPAREAINTSGALGFELPAPDDVFQAWDQVLFRGIADYVQRRDEERWYGVLNWGDWFGERGVNWGNHEYDTMAVFFEQGLRFSRADLFREGLLAATHYIDVDTVSEHPETDLVGAVWAHSLGHTGGYFRPGHLDIANYGGLSDIFHEGRSTPGHTRLYGLTLCYALTGDPRVLEYVRRIADRLIRVTPVGKDRWDYYTAREPGWTMVALCAAYDVTADPKYLAAARSIAQIILNQAEGKGVRHARLPGAHNYAPSRPEGEALPLGELSFPTAYQAAGVIAVYERTGEVALRDNLLATADYIRDRLYFAERGGFVHSPDPHRRQSTQVGGVIGHNLRYPLAFAYAETGDPSYRAVLDGTIQAMVEKNQWYGKADTNQPGPKDFSASVIFWPRIQAQLLRAGWKGAEQF